MDIKMDIIEDLRSTDLKYEAYEYAVEGIKNIMSQRVFEERIIPVLDYFGINHVIVKDNDLQVDYVYRNNKIAEFDKREEIEEAIDYVCPDEIALGYLFEDMPALAHDILVRVHHKKVKVVK